MTWVIGANTVFGYSLVLSDICVTLETGNEINILQKTYPIAKNAVLGFAGSVNIGFKLLKSIKNYIASIDVDGAFAVDHKEVAEQWQHNARKIFNESSKYEQVLASHILIAGISPRQNLGIPGINQSSIIIMRSPDYLPEIHDKANEMTSIGSGSSVGYYKRALEESKSDEFLKLMTLESGGFGGFATAIKFLLTSVLLEKTEIGISKHLHSFLVGKDNVLINNNNQIEYQADGSINEITMPPVATSLGQLKHMLKQRNRESKRAICKI